MVQGLRWTRPHRASWNEAYRRLRGGDPGIAVQRWRARALSGDRLADQGRCPKAQGSARRNGRLGQKPGRVSRARFLGRAPPKISFASALRGLEASARAEANPLIESRQREQRL